MRSDAGQDGLERVRLCAVGLGRWGARLASAFAAERGVEIATVCDVAPERMVALPSEWGTPRTATNLGDALSDPRLDAVIVATPPSSHAAVARAALEAGLGVFVEKPMSLHVEEALQLRSSVKRTGQLLMVGHLLLYHPGVRALKQLLDRGELGQVNRLELTRVGPGTAHRVDAWWALAPHDVSTALFLLGAAPAQVVARTTDANHVGVVAELLFRDNRRAAIEVGFASRTRNRCIRVYGTLGEAWLCEKHTRTYLVWNRPGNRGPQHLEYANNGSPLQCEVRHFLDALRTGGSVSSDVQEGLRVVRVLAAGEKSLHGGHPVHLGRDEPWDGADPTLELPRYV